MFGPGGPTLRELAKQALSSTDEGYDLLASKFERTPFRTPDPLLRAVLPHVFAEPVSAALDLCCGTGAAASLLADEGVPHVVGIDRSEGMLRQARAQLPAEVKLLRGDALALPFEARFDVVVCFGAFGHILPQDEAAFAGNIRRALKPGGRFVFATTTRPPPTSSAYWLARGFNALMRVRNALLKPEFIMYYLTFLWPDVERTLVSAGFEVTAEPLPRALSSAYPEQHELVVVTARRPA